MSGSQADAVCGLLIEQGVSKTENLIAVPATVAVIAKLDVHVTVR